MLNFMLNLNNSYRTNLIDSKSTLKWKKFTLWVDSAEITDLDSDILAILIYHSSLVVSLLSGKKEAPTPMLTFSPGPKPPRL